MAAAASGSAGAAEAGAGGAGGIGTAGADSAGTGGNAGQSGEGGASSACTSPIDVDSNHIPDCQENLVSNADFASDTASWPSQEPMVAVTWSSQDANDRQDSGSLDVIFGTAPSPDRYSSGAMQCIPVTAGQSYAFFAQAFVTPSAYNVTGGLNIVFFTSNDCSGNGYAAYSTGDTTLTGAWVLVSGTTQAQGHSMRVRLDVRKDGADPSSEIRYDNVLVRIAP